MGRKGPRPVYFSLELRFIADNAGEERGRFR